MKISKLVNDWYILASLITHFYDVIVGILKDEVNVLFASIFEALAHFQKSCFCLIKTIKK